MESLESGEVANTADAERMAAILRDMNAAEEGAEREPMPSMVPRMPMPPTNPEPPVSYTETAPKVNKPRRSNFFATIFEKSKGPLIVACLMFILSLPAFHSAAAKVVPWAFAVGGELSYIGLIVKSLFAGGLFAALNFGLAFL